MFEFGLRLVIAAVIFTVSAVFGTPPQDIAWKVSVATVVFGLVGFRLESKNALSGGFAALIASADSFVIATLIGSVGHLNTLGFLVLIPMINAALRHGAQATTMAPIAAASLFASYAMFPGNPMAQDIVLAQAAAVMATGLLFGALRSQSTTYEAERPEFALVQTTDGLIEIRESYRTLKKAYQDLESRTRKPVRLAELEEVRPHRREEFFLNLAKKLAVIGEIESVGVYSYAQFESSMVIRGAAGDYGQKLANSALTVKVHAALSLVRNQTHQALEALKDSADARKVANILLTETTGRIVGMLCLMSQDEDALEEARSRLEELAPSLAQILVDYSRREALLRRANQAELLYETACVTQGATTVQALAERVVQQLWDLSDVDHVGFTLCDDDRTETLISRGAGFQILETMNFTTGTGSEAWRELGSPELAVFDLRSDARCSSADCLKQRIGSMCIAPVSNNLGCVGYLAMATHRAGGVDSAEVETLRTVAVELGRALNRLMTKEEATEGLLTSSEFLGFVSDHPAGCIILLEPIKLDRLEETFGRPELSHAIRQLAGRLRSKLPAGGALCRKPEGSFVAYLPHATRDVAALWANDATAMASMIGLKTPDGSSRIPLGLRAKVAEFGKQEDEILAMEAS